MRKPKLTRRKLFPLGGLGMLGLAGAANAAPQYDLGTNGGLKLTIIWYMNTWHVMVPDWEYNDRDDDKAEWYQNWYPGKAMSFKAMKLDDYLTQVEEACKIGRGTVKL